MIGTTRSLRLFAYAGPYGRVVTELDCAPLTGDCFLFANRDPIRAEVLVWRRTGLSIFRKRLEQGRFACLWQGVRPSDDAKAFLHPREIVKGLLLVKAA